VKIFKRAGTGKSPPEPKDLGGIIICKTGMYRYATFRIDNGEELVIGRDAAVSHIVVDTGAEKVSRKHCSIVYDGRKRHYIVTDYSSNGTYTEAGDRLHGMVLTVLPCGTTIFLGDSQNSFLLN
jgi:predicted component of type VI protein secretion system